jgi:hypothetical protein
MERSELETCISNGRKEGRKEGRRTWVFGIWELWQRTAERSKRKKGKRKSPKPYTYVCL